jgi:hypothetical protein
MEKVLGGMKKYPKWERYFPKKNQRTPENFKGRQFW